MLDDTLLYICTLGQSIPISCGCIFVLSSIQVIIQHFSVIATSNGVEFGVI